MHLGRVAICALCLAAALAGTALAQGDDPQQVAPTEPLPPAEQLKQFRLPPGFEIQLVAAEPEVRKPINMSFDARGRLYVTQSVEYPFPARDAAKARDRVSVLEDFGDDGRAGKVTVLLDQLNIPIGVTPTSDGVIVHSIPNLYRCRDKDGDGSIDSRDAIYRNFGFADTHGMVSSLTRWIDGWVYACHGYSNTSTVKGADGKAITMHSGNTFRFREDGSHIEYFTHGQVNPFGLAFDPLGNLFSTDCHSLPAYQLIRGAWYPSFGKPHDGLGFGPTILRHQHGSTGLAGIVYYAAQHFPKEYHDTLFIGNPITHRINHDKLETRGSTFRAIEQPDFLVCEDPWFRPVDIQLGPDGALYVADFYNRIIGHYEVPLTHPKRDRERGRIWRIIYRGLDGKSPLPRTPADLATATVPRLVELLGHPNLTVRRLVTNALLDRAQDRKEVESSITSLLDGDNKQASAVQRAHAFWVAERCDILDERKLRELAADSDPLVRVHVAKALAEQSRPLLDLARTLLADENAFVRRAAADALGRHPQAESIAPLLKLWEQTASQDTHLIHVVRIALRDHLVAPGIYAKLPGAVTGTQASVARLADVSLAVHSADSAKFMLDFLASRPADAAPVEDQLRHAARHLAADQLANVYAVVERYRGGPKDQQRVALRALHRALQERGMAMPESLRGWAVQLTQELLTAADEGQVRSGIEAAKELSIREAATALGALVARDAKFAALRALALDTLAAVSSEKSLEALAAIVADGGDALELRSKAAMALANIEDGRAREALLKQLPTAPAALALEIARGLARSREGSAALLATVEQGKATASLLQDRAVLDGIGRSGVADAKERVAKLTAGLATPDERIRQLIEHRRGEFARINADATKGQAVFKKICAACHKIGGEGAKVGPELDGIGLRGFDRLLEDVLDPSRTVDQAFRSTQILTEDGLTIVGLKLRTEGEVLVLANNEGKEVRVAASEIVQQAQTKLSPMPANFADALPPEDFYNLVKFLLTQRTPPAAVKSKEPSAGP